MNPTNVFEYLNQTRYFGCGTMQCQRFDFFCNILESIIDIFVHVPFWNTNFYQRWKGEKAIRFVSYLDANCNNSLTVAEMDTNHNVRLVSHQIPFSQYIVTIEHPRLYDYSIVSWNNASWRYLPILNRLPGFAFAAPLLCCGLMLQLIVFVFVMTIEWPLRALFKRYNTIEHP